MDLDTPSHYLLTETTDSFHPGGQSGYSLSCRMSLALKEGARSPPPAERRAFDAPDLRTPNPAPSVKGIDVLGDPFVEYGIPGFADGVNEEEPQE
jgi:hypothetical protein